MSLILGYKRNWSRLRSVLEEISREGPRVKLKIQEMKLIDENQSLLKEEEVVYNPQSRLVDQSLNGIRRHKKEALK